MKKSSPMKYVILIPLGTIALLFIFDFFYTKYNQNIIDNDVQEVLSDLLYRDDLKTKHDYEAYAMEKFKEKGYENLDDITVILDEDKIILIQYRSYFSVVHFITEKEMKIHAQYIGYLNEYKEITIEKYDETGLEVIG